MKAIAFAIGAMTSAIGAFLMVGMGFLLCALGPATHLLSATFGLESISPYDRGQLASIADATRDYGFVTHDELALQQAVYDVARAHLEEEGASDLAAAGEGIPRLGLVTDRGDLGELRAAFDGASERYVLSQGMISHLDDCNAVARMAYVALFVSALVGAAGATCLARMAGKKALGRVLVTAGIIALSAFVVLGGWAALSFDSFFTAFHQLFFSQGNWVFAYDSLLICALPTEFWMGMGAIWLIATTCLAVLAIVVGRRLGRKAW